MASEEEKVKELLARIKRLTDKQSSIEKRMKQVEETLKPKEPEDKVETE